MPGWYIHLDLARKAFLSLDSSSAAPLFGTGGVSVTDINNILRPENRAYAALGAIGPDIFFFLPDFKPPFGQPLWGVANWVREKYTEWDEKFLLPYEFYILPDALNAADIANALTGGLSKEISDIFTAGFQLILDMALSLLFRQYDFFGLLGSGVPQGYDEKTFFWSDMFHYRKTYEFAQHLWTQADQSQSAKKDRFKAFALGWMTHLAADVTGHAFVNEKCGGPYRLHWQRHHVIENHMDAKVYDSEHGAAPIYQMLSCAALHLWIAFDSHNNFASKADFFQAQPGPAYNSSDDAPGILSRKAAWDADPKLDPEFAAFLAHAIRTFFVNISRANTAQMADHPIIIEDMQPSSGGFPDADAIATTYWWLFQYLKFVTTDYFKFRKHPLTVWNFAPFPSPPGTGSSDPPPESTDDPWEDFLQVLGWVIYLGEVIAWGLANLVDLVTGPLSYPIRDFLYDHLELPLYNAWMAVHLYLARTGFVMPLHGEIEPGLMTLGQGEKVDVFNILEAVINDLSGGLLSDIGINPPIVVTTNENSGSDRDQKVYPKNVVLDPPTFTEQELVKGLQVLGFTAARPCDPSEIPSEFLRPWEWPETDNQGDRIPSEFALGQASPYKSGDDALRMLDTAVGDAQARADFEAAGSEAQTRAAIQHHLPAGRTLGSPIDYAAYVIARLTRDQPGAITNLNLDSDRGYAYLCWDWLRDGLFPANPAAYGGGAAPPGPHTYQAPVAPGLAWCQHDLGTPLPGNLQPPPAAAVPPAPVRIRYIDREKKNR
jgi:hypothetical protein